MAIIKMKMIKAAGSINRLDDFIRACYMSGDFHPENAVAFLDPAMGFSPLNEENPYAADVQKIEELASMAGQTLKVKPISQDTPIEPQAKEYINELSLTLDSIHEQRSDLKQQLDLCLDGIEQFMHFENLDIRVDDLFSCEYIKVRFGFMPAENLNKLSAYDDKPYLLFIPVTTDSENCWGIYLSPKDKSDEVDRIFSLLYFKRLHIPGAVGTPKEIIANLNANVDIINADLEKLNKKLTGYWSENAQKITEIYSQFTWLSEGFEMRRYAAVRSRQFYYVGWIPASNVKRFQKAISSLEDVNCEISKAEKNDKNVPVKMKNFLIVRPFNFFVSMYGLPSYGSTDITAFVAFTYTLLFGIMFGDLGQGFVLMIAGFLMWKLKGMDLGKILIPCGASAMFFGFIFGSFFGFEHALAPVYHRMGLAGKPFSVIDSVNTVLLFSIGIGISLVVASMLINVYSCLKSGRFGEALFSHNGIVGIIFYASGVVAATSIFGIKGLVPKPLLVSAMVLSAVALFFSKLLISVIDKKPNEDEGSISDFILQNLFELLEYALSYFSNTVSFLRVGAFVVIHYAMMFVVFTLANDKNIIVIILGNILVIALEGLLTGIQALRLEFYEMFSRFLEGDGRPFTAAGPAVLKKRN